MGREVEDFVNYVFRRMNEDKGFRADLRRADNPQFEWRIWPLINQFAGGIDNDDKRSAYAIVASSIAKCGNKENGSFSLGQAMRIIASSEKNKLSLRFARLLSADDARELIILLRPTLSMITSKGIRLDYVRLLNDLLKYRFEASREQVRISWASDYFNWSDQEGDIE